MIRSRGEKSINVWINIPEDAASSGKPVIKAVILTALPGLVFSPAMRTGVAINIIWPPDGPQSINIFGGSL